jgi:2-oxoglutarate ferredoxin oxidoreductase subunit beta
MQTDLLTVADYKTHEASWWCPGCGDFGVLSALQKALAELQVRPENLAVVAGIGCSGKIGNYVNSYNLHVTHGRTMPAALGLKTANRDLTVIAAGGDGDGYAIGMGHFVHAIRRNADITYVVMDNQIYGLTKGQSSPTSDEGFETRSSPGGTVEDPVRPLILALAAGATFVAQGFSSNQKDLVDILVQAIRHDGFSLVSVLSPCVTFNHVNTYESYRRTLVSVNELPGYDSGNRAAAMAALLQHDELVTGVVFRDPASTSFHAKLAGFDSTPLARQELALSRSEIDRLLSEYA